MLEKPLILQGTKNFTNNMALLNRKIPRKTPLASKALDLLLSDTVEIIPPSSWQDEVRPQRLYVPPSPSTLRPSSILNASTVPASAEWNGKFSAKLNANVAANILASPVRMDKLTRTLLPSGLMIKMGLLATIENDIQKIWLTPGVSKSSLGSKGYILSRKEAFEALASKNRWLAVVPQIISTSSKTAQASFLTPLKTTINRLKKKSKIGSEEPSILFDYDSGLSDKVPDILVGYMAEELNTNILKHHVVRLGLPIKDEYYFTLSWKSAPPVAHNEFCTELISLPSLLSADHSKQIYDLINSKCKSVEVRQSIDIPSNIGLPLQTLLWKYKTYSQ